MIWLIGLYRKYISPLKPPCCRYRPTCSAYAVEAFKKRGFFIGLILSVWRILRCNPFTKGGYDPVPERGLRSPRPADNAARYDLPDAASRLYANRAAKPAGAGGGYKPSERRRRRGTQKRTLLTERTPARSIRAMRLSRASGRRMLRRNR